MTSNTDAVLTRIPLKVERAAIGREIVQAAQVDENLFVVKNIPAFAYGVALGDVIKVSDFDSGEFYVLKRSGQIVIRVYIKGSLDHRHEITSSIDEVLAVGGVFEVGSNKKMPMKPLCY